MKVIQGFNGVKIKEREGKEHKEHKEEQNTKEEKTLYQML